MSMDLSFLPLSLQLSLNQIDLNFLYEIRLRKNYPIIIKVGFNVGYLSTNGFTIDKEEGIICEKRYIDEIIENVTENSIYAFNDRIKNGFLTTLTGVRIGISGECVTDKTTVITIKNITSLNIRVPHEVDDCSLDIFNKIFFGNALLNSLIISLPGYGKTTILKDLAKKINNFIQRPLLIIDERGEFSNVSGENIDLIRYSDKLYAFNYAIRSMSPYVVITDELITQDDWTCVANANESGIKIIASCHSDSIEKLQRKQFFRDCVFDRYFLLDCQNNAGVLKYVYDKDFNLI